MQPVRASHLMKGEPENGLSFWCVSVSESPPNSHSPTTPQKQNDRPRQGSAGRAGRQVAGAAGASRFVNPGPGFFFVCYFWVVSPAMRSINLQGLWTGGR